MLTLRQQQTDGKPEKHLINSNNGVLLQLTGYAVFLFYTQSLSLSFFLSFDTHIFWWPFVIIAWQPLAMVTDMNREGKITKQFSPLFVLFGF